MRDQSQNLAFRVVYSNNPSAGIMRPATTFVNDACTVSIIHFPCCSALPFCMLEKLFCVNKKIRGFYLLGEELILFVCRFLCDVC